jgi:hypothetical protein
MVKTLFPPVVTKAWDRINSTISISYYVAIARGCFGIDTPWDR